MSKDVPFDEAFRALTGNSPFPWQAELYRRFLSGEFPSRCNLPTGLGKTSIQAVWLLALAAESKRVPRRLVYVVNRRTVVDQATKEAENLRNNLKEVKGLEDALRQLAAFESDVPLAISTLRGQFADNGEWLDDPARPAIIVGTVDMIGSRLLFSGYRCGFKTKPTHAGLLGRDSLIVHDEAHLEPAFQSLLESIGSEQRSGNPHDDGRSVHVMQLTATSRGDDRATDDPEEEDRTFALTDADKQHETVRRRIDARKGIAFHEIDDEKQTADSVAERALGHRESGAKVLVFLRTVDAVEKVVGRLTKEKVQVASLTGTLRGLERDVLTGVRRAEEGSDLEKLAAIFARFLPPRRSDDEDEEVITPTPGTVYLVCTAAGEVGVNISADHLVCDLTPFDSMAQRFGRVNRFGGGDAQIDIVHEAEIDAKNDFHEQRRKTLELLRQLPARDDGRLDASPAALGDDGPLSAKDREAAFSPQPEILHVDGILFDSWALTTIHKEPLPGRPPVADWLHGVTEYELPQTQVAWREEVERITDELLLECPPEELLEDFPLKPHELLGDRSDRVFGHLQKLAAVHGERSVWLVDDRGEVKPTTLGEIASDGKERIERLTVLLPPAVGGLGDDGRLDSTKTKGAPTLDVADEWLLDRTGPNGKPLRRRARRWIKAGEENGAPERMRLVREITFATSEEDVIDEEATVRVWRWYVRPRSAEDDDARSWRTAGKRQVLSEHLELADELAGRIVDRLHLDEPVRSAVVFAAKFHDLGKNRRLWQVGVGNTEYDRNDPETILAKSGNLHRPVNHHYRHEFGSLLDLEHPRDADAIRQFRDHPEQELILHLIAAHHGRGRPHFPEVESFDPEHNGEAVGRITAAVPQRFARLQRKYGRWGLAWLESLVRAADATASRLLEEQS